MMREAWSRVRAMLAGRASALAACLTRRARREAPTVRSSEEAGREVPGSGGNLAEMLCIVCPLGCRLQVTPQDDGSYQVAGPSCKLGREYGRREAVAPTRVLTTTLATAWGRPLPVRSAAPIDRGQLLTVQRRLAGMVLEQPIKAGEVVVKDVDGRGVALVATAEGYPPDGQGPAPQP